MSKTGCAIIGSGNIGTDLMIKILTLSDTLALKILIGIDASSEGLAMARELCRNGRTSILCSMRHQLALISSIMKSASRTTNRWWT